MEKEILWIDLQPELNFSNRHLIASLCKNFIVKTWSLLLEQDEACNFQMIEQILLNYLKSNPKQKPHLIGHGLSGSLSYSFAQKYPHLISSLTIISVDTNVFNHWSTHYYKMRSQFCCPRSEILLHLTPLLFGKLSFYNQHIIMKYLKKSLDKNYTLGSLVRTEKINPINKHLNIPLLVINGDVDIIVDNLAEKRWVNLLKSGDRYLILKNGRHFLQYKHFIEISVEISRFIEMVYPKNTETFTSPDNIAIQN